MKRFASIILSIFITAVVFGQKTGYYNGTAGKTGEELKAELNDIISGHMQFSYFFSKEILKLSDADPDNPNNVILVYTGRSHPNNDYGTGGNEINREHVWAKSHGNFADIEPMDNDIHNLKPADASVNIDRSNHDFDNGGEQHPEATGCYFTDDTWEPRDEVKGDIARIIFYMATRYEGENGELDLEAVDAINTFPAPEHGKLSTLLAWNLQDPPDAFERNRNDVIASFQKNRNPFIDNPLFAEMIWGGAAAENLTFVEVSINPLRPFPGDPININATIKSNLGNDISATLFWGLEYENQVHEIEMTSNGDVFSATIPAQDEDVAVYYHIEATDGSNENTSVSYRVEVEKTFNGTLTSIYDIQGQTNTSPYNGQVLSTSGVVTGNFGDKYFIQNGTGEWNGLFIYDPGRNPYIGDSVIITGLVKEYYGITEMTDVEAYYFISGGHQLPEPVVVATGDVGEGHESILVKVENATCTDANYHGDYFMWKVNDGSGTLKIHNSSVFEFEPEENVAYNITGPMNYDFSEWKIELRDESEVQPETYIKAPELVSVEPVLSTNVQILFSEDVEETSAENLANYSIDNGVIIESASQHAIIKSQVNLTVSEMQASSFELTVQNIADMAGNILDMASMQFTVSGIPEDFMNGSLSIYPNPSSEYINITFDAADDQTVNLRLVTPEGKMIRQEMIKAAHGKNEVSFDLKGISQGLYLLNLSTVEGSAYYKIIIR